jgi:hypothetical protein
LSGNLGVGEVGQAERSSGGVITRLERNPAMQQRPIAAGLVAGRESTSHTKSYGLLAVYGRMHVSDARKGPLPGADAAERSQSRGFEFTAHQPFLT